MEFDKAAGATVRELSSHRRHGKPTRVVRASRAFTVDLQELWGALTEKHQLEAWFAEISGEFVTGGRFALKDNAEGEIIDCEPQKKLAVTWEFPGNTSWVMISVEASQDGAVLTLEHELPIDQDSEEHWSKYGPGATGVGWDLTFFGLDVYVSNGNQPSREACESWAETEQGRKTMRHWAASWREAHVRAGEPEQSARKMAESTTRFYTGES